MAAQPTRKAGRTSHGLTAARAGIVSAVVATPILALGGVHPPIQLVLTALLTALVITQLALDGARQRALAWHPLLLLPVCFAVLSTLQTLPLPIELVGVLSPEASEATARLGAAFGESVSHATLSFDQEATRAAATRWWVVALAWFLTLQIAHDRPGRRWIRRVLVITAVVATVSGLVQELAHIERVFGIFDTWHASAGLGGPFVNPNHAAQLATLGAMICAVRLGQGRGKARWLGLGFGWLVGYVVLSQSRGAALGLVAGVAYLVVALRFQKSGDTPTARETRRRGLALAALLLATFATAALFVPGLGGWLDVGEVGNRLDLQKLAIAGGAIVVAGDFIFTGIGADAFGAIQGARLPLITGRHASYVENDAVQLLLDFGLAGLGVTAIAVLVATRRGRQSRHSRPRDSRLWWAVVVAYGVQALTSFTTPVLGLLIPFTALVSAQLLHRRQSRGSWWHRGSLALVAVVVGGGLVIGHPSLNNTTWTPLEAASLRPLDGRHIWEITVNAVTDGAVTRDSVNPNSRGQLEILAGVAELTWEYAKEDWQLKHELTLFALDMGDSDTALDRLDTLWTADQSRSAVLVVAVARDLAPEAVVALCEDHPTDLCEAILWGLEDNRRFDALLTVGLALTDSPIGVYFAIRGAVARGPTPLLAAIGERLVDLIDSTPQDCRFRALATARLGRAAGAREVLETCLDTGLVDDALRWLYLDWAMASREVAALTTQRVDGLLDELNVRARRDPRLWRARIGAQARDGMCSAVTLSQRSAPRGTTSPDWVESACPNGTEARSRSSAP